MKWLQVSVLLVLVSMSLPAQSFMLSPGSIFFEGDVRSAELLVANTHDKKSIFRIETASFLMFANGTLAEVADSSVALNARDIVRFSPRQFELAPGETQTVRIGLRMPPGLPAGEYRIHLRVLQVAEGAGAPAAPTTARDMGMVIPINIARAVRVIVRHDVLAGTAAVSRVAASRSSDGILLTAVLTRSGAGSSSGTYSIGIPGAADSAATGAINIYSDLGQRTVTRAIPAAAMKGQHAICFRYTDGGAAETRNCVNVPSG
jgi:P pilus assembly chaperone PapD